MKTEYLDNLSKIFTIVFGISGAVIAYRTSLWDDSLKAIEAESKVKKIDQDSTLFEREFKFRIYELSVAAIKSKDTLQQEAALLVVSSMVTDSSFKKGLLKLFIKSQSITPKIRKTAKIEYQKEFSSDFSNEFK